MDQQAAKDGEAPAARSGAAWAAIGTVGAAVVTALVTLITFYLPAGRQVTAVPEATETPRSSTQPRPTSAPSSRSAAVSTPASRPPRSILLDQLTGRWTGKVSAGGQSFTMSLDIPNSCDVGLPCGTITTDLHGCVGDLVLMRINDGPQFDLATVDFREGSSSSCQLRTGGGDYFTLGREVLVYATGYDGSLSGMLRRAS